MKLYSLLSVRPSYAVAYDLYEKTSSRANRATQRYYDLTNDSNKAKGNLSHNSKRRMRYAINLLDASSIWQDVPHPVTGAMMKFKLNFITLTLPAMQGSLTDSEVKRHCLNNLLAALRKKYGSFNYVWRAEAQANGNIHFHLATNLYVPYFTMRNFWNRAMNKVGLINEYRRTQEEFHKEGFKERADLFDKWPREKQIAAYDFGIQSQWTQPNSIDIHKVERINNIEAYMLKYMSKDDPDRRKIVGKLWGCSEPLAYTNKYTVEENTVEGIELGIWLSTKKKIKEEGSFHTVYIYDKNDLLNNSPRRFWLRYSKWLKSTREHALDSPPAGSLPLPLP